MVIRVIGNKVLIPLIGEELKCIYCKKYLVDSYGIVLVKKTYMSKSGIVCSDCYRLSKIKAIHVYKDGEYPYLCYRFKSKKLSKRNSKEIES